MAEEGIVSDSVEGIALLMFVHDTVEVIIVVEDFVEDIVDALLEDFEDLASSSAATKVATRARSKEVRRCILTWCFCVENEMEHQLGFEHGLINC